MSTKAYKISANAITLANAALHILYINPGTTRAIEIVRVRFDQSGSSTSVLKTVQFVKQVSAFATVVSATPTPLATSSGASVITGATTGAAGTCGINSSAIGGGTITVMETFTFNEATGFEWIATKDGILMPASGTSAFGVYLPAAMATLTPWNASLTFIEHG